MPGISCLQSMDGLSQQDQDHESIDFYWLLAVSKDRSDRINGHCALVLIVLLALNPRGGIES